MMVIPVSLCKSAAKKIVEELSTVLTNKYNLYSSFKHDFIKLKNDMSAISAVLLDAEKKQENNHLVEDWLMKLRDALHDAEDLLDDINVEFLRQKVEAELKIVTWVRNFCILSDMDDRIKKIIVRINEVANMISSLHLRELDQYQVNASNRQRVMNSISYMRCCREVVGREEDEKKVIERLLEKSDSFVVVPIVGIGGLGKTALVNLIFDDDRIKDGFDLRIWVDVSDDWSIERIWEKKVVRGFDRSSDKNVSGVDFFSCLNDYVRGKKFLLVLDDVWNCNRVEWLDMKKMLLGNCAKGSRIVATTRYKSTASIMGENKNENSLYQLGALVDGDCRYLFEKWAFAEGERVQHPNLVKIGQEIVMKCGGVPLAIRSVGGLLSGTKEESYWMSVKNSDTWSMSHLPEKEDGSTYLRALDLSNIGLTHFPNSIGNMKHLRYLNLNGNNELRILPDSICSLHFLQTLKLSGCRRISTFPKNFSHLVSLRYLVITSPNILEKQLGTLTSLRSLTIECRNLVSLTEVIQNLTSLRTLRIHNCAKLNSLPSSLKNCTALENLEVVNCPMIESLDVCMQGLSSLRSLTIKGLSKLRTLPIKPECYASSLQYLFVIDCICLMILPDCVRTLSSLMRLHIRYCPNLFDLPCGFGQLTSLQVLQIDGCPVLSTRCRRIVGEDWEKIAHVHEIYVDNVRI
ncbi:putative disease resistance protein RGA3 isoform X2 [Cicer arietinum]|uniref:Disease resistance protein RGA4 isoform X2 n=1 Tax=Cicer arietinum TaxID=3827 RepID=A0A3Q7YGE7_CICAR|nr:putative disease resistance protein RGA4 isoform X2 [Cicer arietinum]